MDAKEKTILLRGLGTCITIAAYIGLAYKIGQHPISSMTVSGLLAVTVIAFVVVFNTWRRV